MCNHAGGNRHCGIAPSHRYWAMRQGELGVCERITIFDQITAFLRKWRGSKSIYSQARSIANAGNFKPLTTLYPKAPQPVRWRVSKNRPIRLPCRSCRVRGLAGRLFLGLFDGELIDRQAVAGFVGVEQPVGYGDHE